MRAKQFTFLLGITILCIIIGSHIVKKKVDKRNVAPIELTTEQPLEDYSFKDRSSNIRVVLNTTAYESLYHKTVKLTCSTAYTVTVGDEVKNYEKDHVLSFEQVTDLTTVAPDEKSGKITVLSINRASGNPTYRGILEITNQDKGMILVNQLSIEEYLYGVVPSEMPSGYNMEALKVQAICARSYAIKQMNAGRFKEYGADVDDSVGSQVYNNSGEKGRTNQAVRDTAGKVITYEGDIINAYFFSTSHGYTTDSNDVWYNSEQDNCPPYLIGKYQGKNEKTYNLEKENTFRKFIDQPQLFGTFEKEEDWYRWTIKTDVTEMTKNLKTMGTEYDIGTLKSIKVMERGTGGVVKKIQLVGEDKTITVEKEYQIRRVLAPVNTKVECQNEFSVDKMSILPSGYFYIDQKKDQIEIVGGGYGHGVGMSQNGANNMAAADYDAESIITHYYDNSVVESVY